MDNTLKLFKKAKPTIDEARENPNLSAQIMDRLRYLQDGNVSMTPENVMYAFTSSSNEDFLRHIGRDPKVNIIGHNKDDVAHNTFLLDPNLQQQIFLNNGWVPSEDDTGYKLVKKATKELEKKTGKPTPSYQKFPNGDIKREDLIPLGNIFISSNSGFNVLAPDIAKMGDMGDFPTTLYLHVPTGKVYQFAADLNDYGGNFGGITGLTKILGFHPGDELDKIGNPVIVTSGYREVPSGNFLSYLLDQNLKSLKNKPNNLQQLLNRYWEGHLLDEIVVTPPKKPHPRFNYESPVTTSRHITFNKGGKLIPRKF